MTAKDQNVVSIVSTMQTRLADALGSAVSEPLALAACKELGLVETRRGRSVGGTYATELGLSWAKLPR